MQTKTDKQDGSRLSLQRIWWNNVERADAKTHRRYQFFPLGMFDFLKTLYGGGK